jgi:hypothetical protein
MHERGPRRNPRRGDRSEGAFCRVLKPATLSRNFTNGKNSALPAEIPAGMVAVEPRPDGWFHVQIGRSRGTRRFNLSHAEASQLLEQLASLLPPPISGGDG